MGGRRGWIWGAIGLVIVAAVAWGVMRNQGRPGAPTQMVMTPQPITNSAPATGPVPGPAPLNNDPTAKAPSAGPAPQPWEYDAARNRHYDPNHGHYHDGPPPPPEGRAATAVPAPGVAGSPASGPTPAAWTFDEKNNQHWDPNHGHWHPGPPPPVGSR